MSRPWWRRNGPCLDGQQMDLWQHAAADFRVDRGRSTQWDAVLPREDCRRADLAIGRLRPQSGGIEQQRSGARARRSSQGRDATEFNASPTPPGFSLAKTRGPPAMILAEMQYALEPAGSQAT